MSMRRRQRGRGRGPRPGQVRPAGQEQGGTTRVTSAPAPKRKTVLVVEDNATFGGLTVALLREEGIGRFAPGTLAKRSRWRVIGSPISFCWT